MSAEIKILIDSYNQNESLKATNSELKTMLSTLQNISKARVDKAKQSSSVMDYTKEVTALKQLQKENEKYKQSLDKTTAAEVKLMQEKQKLIQQEEKSAQQKAKTAQEALKLANAEQKQADAAQKAADKLKRQSEPYAMLSAKHRELVREAKNLAAAYGIESAAAQKAAANANKLDVQLKAIDAKMGQHQRNVGNYASAWNGLNNVLGQFGIVLGAGAAIGFLKSSVSAFMEAEKNAHALAFAVKNVAEESDAMFEKLITQSEELQATGGIFSDDDIQRAQTQLVNYGLTTNAVEDLIPKILDLAAAQGVDLATATDQVIKGINGQTKGLKMLGIDFKDTGDKAENYRLTVEGISKFQGTAIEQTETYAGRMSVLENRFDDAKEYVGEFVLGLVDLVDWLFNSADAADELDGSLEDLTDSQKEMIKGLGFKTLRDQYDALIATGVSLTEAEKVKNELLTAEKEDYTDKVATMDDELLKTTLDNLNKGLESYSYFADRRLEITDQEKAAIILAEQKSREDLANLGRDFDAEEEKRKLEAEKKRLALEAKIKKSREQFDREHKEYVERQIKREEDKYERLRSLHDRLAALEEEIAPDQTEREKETARYAEQLKELNDLADAARDEGRFDQERYNRDLELIDTQHYERMEDIRDKEIDKEIDDEKRKKDELKKIDDEIRKKQKEELERTISEIEEFGNKVNDARLQQSERNLSLIEKQIEKQDEMVDLQRQRAIRGQENTLAFEEKRKADLERAAITEQKRQEKIKKQDAYWSLLAAFAKSDGDEAAQKAALEIAEGIAISAAFAEKGGMGEDLKDTTTLSADGWSKTHGSGDVLAMLSPKEGVLTEKAIANLGGKDAFYDLKWNLENMAKNPIPDDVFEKQNESFMNVSLRKVEKIDTRPIEDKLDKVVDAISKIEVHKHEVDKWGNYLLTVQKQNSKIITDKGRFVKPQRNKFIS